MRAGWLRNTLLVTGLLGLAALVPAAAQTPPAPPAPPPPKVLLFGALVDANTKLQSNVAVVVENGRIKSIGPRASAPANMETVDLSGYTAIPGLIDVHTHIAGNPGAPAGIGRGAPYGQILPRHPAIDMVRGQAAAKAMLEHGTTSVRNLGAIDFLDTALRELIANGDLAGPRIFASGPGLRTSSALGYLIPEVTVNSPDDVRRVVRWLIANGVDCIKIFGSTGNGLDLTGEPTFTYEELAAAAEAAHQHNVKVAVHTYGPLGAKDAVRAGVDSIEHGTDLDDATIADMAKRGTFFSPTIDHNRWYLEHAARTDEDKEALRSYIARNLESTRKAVKAGVRLVMGSDGTGTGVFGENTNELGWFVKAGLTPGQALAAATVNGAALLGKEKDLGKLAPGYIADIVAVQGDPLADVNVTINGVRWVMKGGAVMVDKTKASAAK